MKASTSFASAGRVALFALAFCASTARMAAAEDAAADREAHRRMVERLEVLAKRADEEHPTLGRKLLRDLTTSADAAERGDSAPGGVQLLVYLGYFETSAGNTEAADRAFTRAEAVAARIPERDRPGYLAVITFERGVTALRESETRNCAARHTAESCILPIRGGGVHTDTEPVLRAAAHFRRVIELSPPGSWLSTCARWLLNIATMAAGEAAAPLPDALRIDFTPREEFPLFREVASEAGVASEELAGGAILDDFDDDGHLDLVTSDSAIRGPMHFYRGKGDGSFDKRSVEAGLEGITGSLGLSQADYDGDGDIDVFVPRGAWQRAFGAQPSSLLRNDGRGVFTDVTEQSGLGDFEAPSQVGAWSDYDLDGDLDLFVAVEGNTTEPAAAGGRSRLFRNDGSGRFADVAAEAGVINERFAKGATWGDYDGDGWPDLYVSNLEGDNRLFHNEKDGRFRDVAADLGVTGPWQSFATWFWDYDNDGALDLFVTAYPIDAGKGVIPPALRVAVPGFLGKTAAAETTRLYKGDGRGGFREVSAEVGLDHVVLAMGANFGDFDNDGFPDLYLGTGYPGIEGLLPNVALHNVAGSRFRDVTIASGLGHLQKGHGIAFGDVDEDGDEDIFLHNGGFVPVDVFRNALFENPGFGNHWLGVEVRSDGANRFGIGARVEATFVDGGRTRTVYGDIHSGGSFGSSPLRVHLGLGKATRVDRLVVRRPGGQVQELRDVAVDRLIRVVQGRDQPEVRPASAPSPK